MSVIVKCTNPACGYRFLVPEDFVGRTGKCSQCKTKFTMTPSADPKAPEPSAPPGASQGTIGRFQVRARLGAGAFGTVYRAYDPHLEREVALKVPQAGVLDSPQRVERFLREAKAAAGLFHPNIVPVYDAGQHDGAYYIASAFVEGKPLAAAVHEEHGMGPHRAARIVHDLAEALAYAHDQGVVHRDVKPANVMLDIEDRPHLMDFGLAARLESTEKLTHEGAVLGTPSYMAPEQARGQQGEARPESDQYSLGVVLYELLTGRTPFEGPPQVILFNVLNEEPPAPRTLRKDLPRDLETICLKAMAKLPQDRYASCHTLAADLRRWMEGEPIRARRLGVGERFVRWCKKEPKLAAAGGLTLASLTLAVVLLFVRVGNLLAEVLSERQAKEQAVEQTDQARAKLGAEEEAHGATRRAGYGLALGKAQAQMEGGDPAGAVRNLALCLPEYRGWEWRHLLLLGEGAPEAVRVLRQPMGVAGLAYSADSLRLAVLCIDGTLLVWDLHTGTTLSTVRLRGPLFGQIHLALSADGTRVATFRPANQRVPLPAPAPAVKAPPEAAREPAEPAGAIKPGQLVIWNAQTGERVVALAAEFKGPQFHFALSPDGKYLAFAEAEMWGGPAALKVWDAQTGKEVLAFEKKFDQLRSLAYSPDGGRILTVSGGTRTTWKPESREVEEPGEDGKPTKRTVTVNVPVVDKAPVLAQLWEAQTGKESVTLEELPEDIFQLTFSPDGERLGAYTAGRQEVMKTVAETIFTKVFEKRTRDLPGGKKEEYEVAKDVPQTVTKAVKELVGSGEATIRVWNARTGKGVLQVKDLGGPVSCIAFSPDGSRLAAYGTGRCAPDGQLTLWDARGGQRLCVFTRQLRAYLQVLAFSPDGQYLAGASLNQGREVVVWSARRGRILHSYEGHEEPIACLRWSPDGRLISSFAACSGTARVWEARTGKEVLTTQGGYGGFGGYYGGPVVPATYASFAPGAGGDLLAWLPGYRRGISAMPSGPGGGCLGGIAFSRDGGLLVQGGSMGAGCYGAYGGYGSPPSVRLWERASAREVPPPKDVRSVLAVSPDGTRIVTSAGGTKTEYKKVQRTITVRTPEGREEARTVEETVPVQAQTPLQAQVRQATTGEVICRLEGIGEPITCVVFSPDGTRLATASERWPVLRPRVVGEEAPEVVQPEGEVKLWDAQSGRLLATHRNASGTFAFSPDSTRLASANRVPPPAMPLPGPPPPSRAALPAGKGLLAALLLLQPPPAQPLPPGKSPPAKPAAPPPPPEVKLFDAQTGKEIVTLKDLKGPVMSMDFAPDSRSLLTMGGDLKVWDVKTARAILTHAGAADWAFSLDGARLVLAPANGFGGPEPPLIAQPAAPPAPGPQPKPAAPPKEARVWDLRTGREVLTLEGSRGPLASLVYSPDGTLIAAGTSVGGDPSGPLALDGRNLPGEVRVWNAKTGRLVLTFRGHTGGVHAVAFSPESRRIASGGEDGMVKVWSIVLPAPAGGADEVP